ncbi:MAG: DUF1294 domain-containing protein [Agathobacter sp.]|nr:DUF1294 domain-containing protein [Agathobacter sp.]
MSEGLKIALIFMVFMSMVGFCAMGIDKAKAKANAWRIPEKTLFGIAFAGGGAGIWLGMEVFRHKTKHWYFKYGAPAICLLEFIAVCYVFS